LRDAITLANTTPGADTIAFHISGTGIHTITPLTVLPNITEAVTIDGYTQPGSSMNTLANGDDAVLKIELNGSTVEASQGLLAGLTIAASNCTERQHDSGQLHRNQRHGQCNAGGATPAALTSFARPTISLAARRPEPGMLSPATPAKALPLVRQTA